MSRRPQAAQMGFPPLTRVAKILIAINFGMWALTLILYHAEPATLATVLKVGVLDPQLVLSGYLHQLATYMFLHDLNSPFHVLMNMLLVYFFAAPLEKRWGTKKTLLFAFGGGIAGGVMVMVFHLVGQGLGFPGHAPVIGFSGAALAMLAAFCWINAEAKILLFFVIPVKAKYLLPMTIAIDFLIWISAGPSQVAFSAHLGGILFATLLLTDGWKPKTLLYRVRYWKIRRELDKRKASGENVVKGPWLH